MWTCIFAVTTVISAVGWIKWRIATMSLVYYIEKNQYKQPDDAEMAECTGYVAEHLFKFKRGRNGL